MPGSCPSSQPRVQSSNEIKYLVLYLIQVYNLIQRITKKILCKQEKMNSSSGSADKTTPHLLSPYYVQESYRSFPTIISPKSRYNYAPFTHRADGPF